MRVPLPRNRLVALALAGALLTGIVAVGLAVPGLGGDAAAAGSDAVPAGANAGTAADAPTPNANFTPAVSTSSGGRGEYEEHERYEEEHEDEEHEDEEHEG